MKPHLELAHQTWERHVRPGDAAIDATCGNGKDTLKLALLGAHVMGIDIQEAALEKTRLLLNQHLKPEELARVRLICQSHASFPEVAFLTPIRLIVYNLGYLPGGNKEIATQTETTLQSFRAAQALLAPGGLISVVCYPGHPEGAREVPALLEAVSRLPSPAWRVSHRTWPQSSPSLLLIVKS